MKKKPRILNIILTAAVLSMAIQTDNPAYGASQLGAPQDTLIVFEEGKKTKDVETELVGNIEVTIISVILPSDVDFTINPREEFDVTTAPAGQITSPANLAVTNNSVVPIRLEIDEVPELRPGDMKMTETFPGGPAQSFRLVDQISEVEKPGTAILVLGRKDRIYTSASDFEQYAICPGRRGIPVTDMAAEETVDLSIYGKAAADFYGAYQFTVRPTLKISAVRSH